MRSAIVSGPILVLLLLWSGCRAPEREVVVWVDRGIASTGIATTWMGAIAPDSQSVSISSAMNETVGFCLAVKVGDAPIHKPQLVATPLRSPSSSVPAESVAISRLHRVGVPSWPGWHISSLPPDARVDRPWDVVVPLRAPTGGMPEVLRPQREYRFWVDVVVPNGTFEGSYAGDIQLRSGADIVTSVAVSLTVWPFLLPSEADVFAVVPVNHKQLFAHAGWMPHESGPINWQDHPERDRLDALLLGTMRMLRAHRLTPVLPELSPHVRVGEGGRLSIDWSGYDAVTEGCLGGRAMLDRARLRAWPLPIAHVLTPWRDNESSSPRHRRMQWDYLQQVATHFAKRGWLDRSYAALPMSDGPSRAMFDAIDRFVVQTGRTEPPISALCAWFPQDAGPYGWTDYPHQPFGSDVDIWAPTAQFYEPKTMTDLRSAGKRTWLTADRPPFSGTTHIAARPVDARILPWQASRLAAEALVLPPANAWPESTASSSRAQQCLHADPHTLLYPGVPYGLDEPVASVRLKHLRRGLQDLAYVALLNEHGLSHLARSIVESVSLRAGTEAYDTHYADGRPNGWPASSSVLDIAREVMAGELMARAHGDQTRPKAEDFAQSVNWQRLMRATRSVDMQPDGCRVRIGNSPAGAIAQIDVHVTIRNHTRLPVDGTLRLADLPSGWLAVDGEKLLHIPPAEARRIRLRAESARVPSSPTGRLTLPVELLTDDGDTRVVEAHVACAMIAPISRTLTIDGDLSDWPAGQVNVMSDFKLIAGAIPTTTQANATPDTQRRPTHATTGFALIDDDYMYIGVTCQTDGRIVKETSRRNAVRYEDMVPTDEELVEILIDPLNAGTRSPSDLLHIAVKRSGAYLLEKGIRFDPPCGQRTTWPADVAIATKVTRTRWSCEVRIPLASMMQGPTDPSIWALNLTRLDAVHNEFSTWSGATTNAYDPLSLGNLCFPRPQPAGGDAYTEQP